MAHLKGKTFLYDRGESYCCGEIIEEINDGYVLVKHFDIKTMSSDKEASTISVVALEDMSREVIMEEDWERPKWNLFENKEKLVAYLAWLDDASESRGASESPAQTH